MTELVGVNAVAPVFTLGSPSVPTSIGVRVSDYGPDSAVTDAYGVYIANITSATGVRRLIEALGASTANLRVEAGDPGSDASNVLIAVDNGAVVLRRIEIGAADSAGSGYRALRVLN